MRVFKIILLLSFIVVPALDIGFLDIDEAAAAATHAQLGLDYEGMGAEPDIHCGCDMLHHLFASLSKNSAIRKHQSEQWVPLFEFTRSRSEEPPVHPPSA